MFGPKSDDELVVFAVERFRVDVQHKLQKLMNVRGVTKKELARRLGVSPARVSQMFSDDCNVTIRLIARAFFVLGDECVLASRCLDALDKPSAHGGGHWTTAPDAVVAGSGNLSELRLIPKGRDHSRANSETWTSEPRVA